jgi:hypothetical protein
MSRFKFIRQLFLAIITTLGLFTTQAFALSQCTSLKNSTWLTVVTLTPVDHSNPVHPPVPLPVIVHITNVDASGGLSGTIDGDALSSINSRCYEIDGVIAMLAFSNQGGDRYFNAVNSISTDPNFMPINLYIARGRFDWFFEGVYYSNADEANLTRYQ